MGGEVDMGLAIMKIGGKGLPLLFPVDGGGVENFDGVDLGMTEREEVRFDPASDEASIRFRVL